MKYKLRNRSQERNKEGVQKEQIVSFPFPRTEWRRDKGKTLLLCELGMIEVQLQHLRIEIDIKGKKADAEHMSKEVIGITIEKAKKQRTRGEGRR